MDLFAAATPRGTWTTCGRAGPKLLSGPKGVSSYSSYQKTFQVSCAAPAPASSSAYVFSCRTSSNIHAPGWLQAYCGKQRFKTTTQADIAAAAGHWMLDTFTAYTDGEWDTLVSKLGDDEALKGHAACMGTAGEL